MNIEFDVAGEDISLLEPLLEGLVQVNQSLIRRGLVEPLPMLAPVRYAREGQGLERWQHAGHVSSMGEGDCEDLNGWLVAGLRELGLDPYATLVLRRTGERSYHAVAELSDGRVLDCCPMLGMAVPHELEPAAAAISGVLSRIAMRVASSRNRRRRTAAATAIVPGGAGRREVVPLGPDGDVLLPGGSVNEDSLPSGGALEYSYAEAQPYDPYASEAQPYDPYASEAQPYDPYASDEPDAHEEEDASWSE